MLDLVISGLIFGDHQVLEECVGARSDVLPAIPPALRMGGQSTPQEPAPKRMGQRHSPARSPLSRASRSSGMCCFSDWFGDAFPD